MTYYVLGTMSGSSLDGLDLVHATITLAAGKWQYEILNKKHIVYSDEWEQALKNAPQMSGKELIQLDRSYGKWVAEQINSFIEEHDFTYNLHLIGHHGHTVFHEPKAGFTYQIGTGAEVAAITGYPTVTHLRDMNVSLGGEGAPIIPIVDTLLFAGYQAYLNFGGICNMTIQDEEKWKAKDLTFCNQLLNHFAKALGDDYDKNGHWAQEGMIHQETLDKINDLPYFQQKDSDSLSNEQFSEWLQVFEGLDPKDALATVVEHVAIKATDYLNAHLDPRMEQKVMMTGGGAFNNYLIERLKSISEEKGLTIDWFLPDPVLIDYKEALGMAFIAILRWREENNVLSEYSGAERDSIGGALWMGKH